MANTICGGAAAPLCLLTGNDVQAISADVLWAAHGYTPDDLYDAALWAAHDLNNRLQRPDLGFTPEATRALVKVIDAVSSLKELEGWDGFDILRLQANFCEQEVAQ